MEKPEKTIIRPARVRDQIEAASSPKPMLRSDAETVQVLTELLNKVPDMPFFINMFEVTEWLDKTYRLWLQQVRKEVPK